MEFAILLESLNVLLLLALIYVYVQNYLQMKTHFGLGLVLFAFLLLVQNALALYFHLMMLELYSKEAMQHAFFLSALQTAGLIVLNWVTWKE